MTPTPNGTLVEPLRAPDLDRIDKPALEAYNLPPEYFNSPELYELELQRVFRQTWVCVGRSEDVISGADPLVRMVGPEAVSLRRRADGSVTSDRRLAVWQGFLFVNLDGNARRLEDGLSETGTWGMENYALHDERSIHSWEWDCASNWKLLVENFVEEYHVAWVHAKSFNPTMPMKRWASYPELTKQPWTYMFGPFHETSMSVEGPALFPLIESLSERERGGMGIVTLFPNLMLILAVDCLVYYYVLPDGVGQTKVIAHLCVPSAVAQRVAAGDESVAPAVAEYIENTQMILDEDIEASDHQAAGLTSRHARAGRVCKHELLLSTFHHWLLDTVYRPAGEA